ncbi:hypothetical protein Vafri_20496 [Volvox africanus]|uniref:Uncharacterized protein n=2 Tax=Volvox africanus TaxID=51714 RepID=A0A8J4BX16_9CHLO|nr:hypothetical protein Vafri_20496 [Volvox africanus]
MPSAGAGPSSPVGSLLDTLPDEILIQIFGHLAIVGSVWEEDDPLQLTCLPYRQSDVEVMPSTGLRGYPFLAQVCRKWRRLLATPMAQQLVWQRLCIDLGHELVTSIHAPLRWSNQRPSNEEYQMALRRTSISASKVLRFLGDVAPHVRALALANTEGFDGEDGQYVSLENKHDFGPSHLGFALALLQKTLTKLVLYLCNDMISADSGLWTLATQLPVLRVLEVEGLRVSVPDVQVAALGELQKLEALALTGDEFRSGSGMSFGLEGIPAAWSRLTALTRLELRGHPQLYELPVWLTALGALRHLDVSACEDMEVGSITQLTSLHVLVLQSMHMGHALPSPADVASAALSDQELARHALPDLQPLAPCLRSLSLSNNRFTQLPDWLYRLTRLEHLDVSYNRDLHVRAPLTGLASLPYIRLFDFRAVHVSKDKDFWCEAKCITMQHLSKLAKALKRRCPQPRLLLDI